MNEKIICQTDLYYSDKIAQFGATNKGVDWNSVESQRERFHQLTRIISENDTQGFSICDYGCGYGYYSEYLKERGLNGKYTGIDLCQAMVDAARRIYGNDKNTSFVLGTEIDRDYDYIVSSGIFNVRQDLSDEEWLKYILEVLDRFDRHTRKGFAFNMLTSYSDAEYMKDYLYYADPLYIFDHCKRCYAKDVALLHDYRLYEFTILVRKS